jgi:acyl-CoA synthetase (NDP forming)
VRLIGPNGMGVYCPKTGLSFFPQLSREPGPVGIISHSGSLTNILGRIAPQRGIRFSKVISSGNECDLTAADFLIYLGSDADTGCIGAYIEGIKDGARFMPALLEAASRKPVIVWKVGLTTEGSRAAVSHTGALRTSKNVWQAVARQAGVVSVTGFEEWVDTLMGFCMLPAGLGRRIAIISGPGGLAVSAAEACGKESLNLAELSTQTRTALAEFIPATGTSVKNPIDVSLSAHFDLSIFRRSARQAAADPGVDAVVMIGCGMTPEDNRKFADELIPVTSEFKKPILMVKIPGVNQELGQHFCSAGIPFFDSAERAMRTYAHVWRYQQRRRKRA